MDALAKNVSIGLLVATAAFGAMGTAQAAGLFGTEALATGYADMSGYGVSSDSFVEMSYEEAFGFIAGGGTGIILLGYESCPWCQDAVPVLADVADELGENVYYVDKLSESATDEGVEALTELIDSQIGLEEDGEGNPRIYYPTVIAVYEGEIVYRNLGTVSGHDATAREMSEEETEELYQIYEYMFSLAEE